MKIAQCVRLSFFAALALSACMQTARADQYVEANWPNLVKTLVRFNAISLSDTSLLDEYATITECDLYKAFYNDDFKWHDVQVAVLKSVDMFAPTYPVSYHYDVDLQLDRYDFKSQLYHLTNKSTLRNVNTFLLYFVTGTGCGTANVQLMPRRFDAVLDAPFYLDSLPLAEKDAHELLKQMDADNNQDHIIYARFNIRVVYVQPLRKEITGRGAETVTHYVQPNSLTGYSVRFDSKLESVNFYEDPAHTKLVYQFQP